MPDPPDTRTVRLTWTGDLRFEGGAPDGPLTAIDADNTTAPGPMQQLLLAAGSCTGADLVGILHKMQVDLRKLEIEAVGRRAPDHPRRYLAIHLTFHIAGEGADEPKARRAIDLSITKYCSVLNSLNPDIPVTYELVLE